MHFTRVLTVTREQKTPKMHMKMLRSLKNRQVKHSCAQVMTASEMEADRKLLATLFMGCGVWVKKLPELRYPSGTGEALKP